LTFARQRPTALLRVAIRHFQAGEWTVHDCALYLGYSLSHTHRVLHGLRRPDAMRAVDPSSCSPVYIQATRPTCCPRCEQGTFWQRLEPVMGPYGQMTYCCPQCGWSS